MASVLMAFCRRRVLATRTLYYYSQSSHSMGHGEAGPISLCKSNQSFLGPNALCTARYALISQIGPAYGASRSTDTTLRHA